MGATSARSATGAAVVAAFVWAPLAQGQLPSQPITPGGVLDTLKRPPELAPAEPLQSPAAQPAPRPNAAPATLAKTISVERFEFAGNTLYSSDVLNGQVGSFLQRPITLIELYEAADKITEFYVSQGYTLASAVVPAQKVTEGTVRLEVIEGRIGTVRYEGLRRYKAADLNDVLETAPGRIYRADDFEQNLRLVDGLPGLAVRARLQPGAEYGSSDVVILAREQPIQGSVFFDNAGTQNIGTLRGGVQLTVNNPLGVSDQLSLTSLRSEGGQLRYGAGTYSLPTGLDGSRLALTYGYAQFDVAGAFTGVSGSNRTVRGELQVPVQDDGVTRTSFFAAVDDTRANTDFTGITFNETAVTALELGGNVSYTAANRAVTLLAVALSSNFTDNDAVTDTASLPLKVDLDLQQLTSLPHQLQLLTRAQFVYGIDPLPDTRKFSVGGPASVRGYAPSEARGDWGYLAQVTLRRPYLIGPTVVAPRLFYDAGAVRQHKADRFPLGAQPQDVSLASYGFGAELSYFGISLSLDYAVPTTDTPVSDGKEDGRLYGALSLTF